MQTLRYPELDASRGLAVLLMAAYHLHFDLTYYYGFALAFMPSQVVARSVASLFLLIVGICAAISLSRTEPNRRWNKSFRRAVVVLAGAMVISLATWIFDAESFVVFGILHLIGVSALLQPLFFRFERWNLALGALMFSTIFFLPTYTNTSLLLPFGLMPKDFFSLDYYPLLPWFGVVLFGMGLAHLLYIPSPAPAVLPLQRLPYPRWLLWSGRRSLWIYVLHQPVLLLLLYLMLGR